MGTSVVVTREASQGEAVIAQLQSLGAEVVNLPVLAFVEPDDSAPLNACLSRLSEFGGSPSPVPTEWKLS